MSTCLRGVDGEPMTSSSPVAATSSGGTSNNGTSQANPWSSKRATMVGGPFNTLATKWTHARAAAESPSSSKTGVALREDVGEGAVQAQIV